MSRILLTGGTGLVGKLFADQNPNVLVTSRNAERARQSLGNSIVDAIAWPDSSQPVDLAPHQPIRAVVNLMGESVAQGRWTAEKKKRIYESRILDNIFQVREPGMYA